MMDFELKLDKPNVSRAWISTATMGLSYFLGGLMPITPYFAMNEATDALFVSIGITSFCSRLATLRAGSRLRASGLLSGAQSKPS
jgi:VIT1/CCC1 family predicted Fe2+/Mn2+ transporter